MLEQFYSDFMSVVPLQLPKLLDTRTMEKPEVYDMYMLLTFPLATAYSIEDVMNLLEDEMEMILLYHHIPSTQTVFGHSCCAYSNPVFGRMFKINVKTNSAGLVDLINVTIFGSLEVFSAEVCVDLELHAKTGHFKYKKSKEEVLLDFIS